MEEKIKKHKPALEEFGWEEDGVFYWWGRWYADILGYRSFASFKNPMRKAMQACVTLGIDLEQNFSKVKRTIKGRQKEDFRLSRFACYLIAMNADSRKPIVAKAQIYFAEQIEKVNIILGDQKAIDFDRLMIREELKEGNQDLISAAGRSGVKNFGLFMNEGYVGMYNRSASELKDLRKIHQEESLYDHMGTTELAANLFRLSLTKESLDRKKVWDQERAIMIHKRIAEDIRHLILQNTGRRLEDFPQETSLHTLSTQLKKASRLMKKNAAKSTADKDHNKD